jgi:hypothetical protein
MQIVAGIFASRATAERTARQLHALGLPPDRVSVLVPGAPDDVHRVPTDEGEAPGTGAAICEDALARGQSVVVALVDDADRADPARRALAAEGGKNWTTCASSGGAASARPSAPAMAPRRSRASRPIGTASRPR